MLRSVLERQQYGCIHLSKATRGKITSEGYSRKEAQTRLVCVLNTSPKIFLELMYLKLKKMENYGRLSSTAISLHRLCVYGRTYLEEPCEYR